MLTLFKFPFFDREDKKTIISKLFSFSNLCTVKIYTLIKKFKIFIIGYEFNFA